MTKAERALETRERILKAACEVIAEIGFENVSMRKVAEHAGVSKALLHYHFDTREKLFAEAMTHSFAQTGTDTEDGGDTAPATVVLARILRSMLPSDADLRQDWKLWQELWVRAQRDQTARHLAVDLYDQLHTWVGGAVERGIESGEFTECDVAAVSTLVLALCDGLGIRLMLDDPRVDLATARSTIWQAIAPALGIAPVFPEV
ncbi:MULTISPECIES: TetR/AcrR family transcriptional regulator [unclassified Streptomyces]|uniref:TetR/AcrR family transcriptional regulator n=1 Tax=unclassified Streptomyces TaxID=2593676 RepID=UPI0006B1E3D5|nr:MULTISPECIES: TetR/AcrR family transcriptional regulator [unclassified Streptomyces]KOY56170.1 TetR family transcriptional regulator [Streptomyces sp. XY332]THA32819.1 TetR family transcriptional regulator [Streptomyces sp. A1547]